MKNAFFYNTQDVQKMKDLIRTGQPLLQIARNEHANFNAPLQGFYLKLQKLAKSTRKVRTWEGPKKLRKTKRELFQAREQEQVQKGFVVPQGTTFEGTPKKVEIYADHFRIYF